MLLGHLDQDAQHLPVEQRHAFDTLTVAITARREQARERMLKTLRAQRYMRLLEVAIGTATQARLLSA